MTKTTSRIAALDIPSLEVPKPRLSLVPKPVVATDWGWMLEQAARSGSERSVQTELRSWEATRRKRYGKLVADRLIDAMKAFEHKVLYTITEADVNAALARTDSSYGGVTGSDSKIGNIHKASSPAPISLMLHRLLETNAAVPTWQDFQEYHWRHPHVFLKYMVDHVPERIDVPKLSLDMLIDSDWLAHPVARAIRFRLATAYNSFIRELHFMCALRERHGILLTHHFLLDALWKIDFLHGNTALEVFLESEWKKRAPEERAIKAKCYLHNPARDVLMVTFLQRKDSKTYNRPWLLADRDIDEVARRLLAREVDYRRRPTL